MGKEHDALFKIGFASEEAARSQLASLLPEDLLAAVDLGSLELQPTSFVDDGLSEVRSDRLYAVRVRDRDALIYVLDEHQSTPDELMPYRLLRYLVRIWEWWIEQQSERPTSLPAVIPVVLYHGVKPWDVATRFLELIDLPSEALAATAACLPEFEFILDDLSGLSDEELRARGAPALATITLLLFKHGRHGEDLLAVWRSLKDLLSELASSRDWSMGLRAVTRYTYRVGNVPTHKLAELVEESMGAEAKEVVMTTAERLLEQGRVDGERRLLLRLLRKRFGSVPDAIERKISTAAEAEVEAWSDRLLAAGTLDEVFT